MNIEMVSNAFLIPYPKRLRLQMGKTLYLVENLMVFFETFYHLLIYFKIVPKSIKFIEGGRERGY